MSAVRQAMADLAGLAGDFVGARLVRPDAGVVAAASMWRAPCEARIGQTCVVTLDPIDNEIDETVDVMFAPSEQIPQLADLAHEALAGEAEIPDAPEPIVDGVIDLGRLATDVLLLAIDPYPRKPGAVFEPGSQPPIPEDHPFAALKALQLEPKTVGCEQEPKGKRMGAWNGVRLATSRQGRSEVAWEIENNDLK